MFVDPIVSDEATNICCMKLANGFYHGQADKHSLNGLGAFYWDTGEFYFGEWENGVQNVPVSPYQGRRNHVSRHRGLCTGQLY
jgi:hypothetical protein